MASVSQRHSQLVNCIINNEMGAFFEWSDAKESVGKNDFPCYVKPYLEFENVYGFNGLLRVNYFIELPST